MRKVSLHYVSKNIPVWYHFVGEKLVAIIGGGRLCRHSKREFESARVEFEFKITTFEFAPFATFHRGILN